MAIQAADRKQVPINMCGQMSGSPLYTMLLLGMGLRQFSVTPSAIPEVKNVCRSVTIAECEAVAARVMTMENARDVKSYLKEEVKKHVREIVRVRRQRRWSGRRVAATATTVRATWRLTRKMVPRRQRQWRGKSDLMVRLRVRIRFSKQGDLRLIGHRDLMRCLERLFRRAGLALSFSQGFHPKPRMTFPLALAVGIEGVDEVMEVELAESYTAEELLRRLSPQAPPGLVFRAVEVLPEGSRKAQVRSASYEAPIPAAVPGRPGRADRASAGRRRRGRSSARTGDAPIDLRPLLLELALGEGVLAMRLRVDSRRQRRPARRAGGAWTWPTSSSKASACAAPPWRSAHDVAQLAARRAACLPPMRTRRYCRTRKRQHETGNADQRRAAGRMPHRDR